MFRNHRNWVLNAATVLSLGIMLSVSSNGLSQDNSHTGTTKTTGNRKVKTSVPPQYPELARKMRILGTVRIEATVAADGHVRQTKVLGGSPLLTVEAENAVKRWRFEEAPKETVEIVEIVFQ